MPKPDHGSYPAYFDNYIKQVPESDIFQAFKNQRNIIAEYFTSINENRTNEGYAPGKWSLKELLQHMIDTERIFQFRSLCFARKEKISLPGFDENEYASNSNGNSRTWVDLCQEFIVVRESSEFLFNSFTNDMLQQTGLANNNTISVNALGFIIVGHVYHHINVINTRYLV